MSCFKVTNAESSSILHEEDVGCLQKPLTKTALFVISLLFAGGAVAAHFAGLGIAGIVSFSIVSAGFMVVFAVANAFQPKGASQQTKSTSHHSDQQKSVDLEKQKEIKEKQQKAALEKLANQIQGMSFAELIQEAPQMDPLVLENVSEREKMIAGCLVRKIGDLIKDKSLFGETVVANALKPIFSLTKNDPVKLHDFVLCVLMADCTLKFLITVLEQLEWPSQEVKEEVLPKCLGMIFTDYLIYDEQGYFEFNSDRGMKACEISVYPTKIFGQGDFVAEPGQIPKFLVQGLGYAIHYAAQEEMKQQTQQLSEESPVGIKVTISQAMECRFSAEDIAPILPFLRALPGLISLNMRDIGVRHSFDVYLPEKNHGFKDSDEAVLNQIVATNPFLMEVGFNLNGMKEETKVRLNKAYEEETQKRLTTFDRQKLIDHVVEESKKQRGGN